MARVVALPQLALLLMTACGPVAQSNPGSSPAASYRATTAPSPTPVGKHVFVIVAREHVLPVGRQKSIQLIQRAACWRPRRVNATSRCATPTVSPIEGHRTERTFAALQYPSPDSSPARLQAVMNAARTCPLSIRELHLGAP